MSTEIEDLRTERDDWMARAGIAEAKWNQLEAELNTLKHNFRNIVGERDGLEAERDALQTTKATLQRQLDAVDAAVGFPTDEGYGRIEIIKALQQQLVEMQKHRDHWRGYAYGLRDKPQDFTDGNMVDPRPMTFLEINALKLAAAGAESARLRASLEELNQEYHAAINEHSYAGTRADWIYRAQSAEAKVDRLRAALQQLVKRWHAHATLEAPGNSQYSAALDDCVTDIDKLLAGNADV